MTNRINGYENAQSVAPSKGPNGGVQGADKAQSEATAATAASSTADQVTLTGSARTLQKLGDAVANTPVVNTEKVASVKQAVQGGTYKVNAQSVADKLLQYENGLS